MCTGGNKAPPPKEIEKPVFIRNPYLDDQDRSSGAGPGRVNRSSLAIPLETGIGFEGRGGSSRGTDGGNPMGNAKPAAGGPSVLSAASPASLPIRPAPPGTATPTGPRVAPIAPRRQPRRGVLRDQ